MSAIAVSFGERLFKNGDMSMRLPKSYVSAVNTVGVTEMLDIHEHSLTQWRFT